MINKYYLSNIIDNPHKKITCYYKLDIYLLKLYL